MAWVMPLIPLGMSICKIYQNSQPDARQANSDEMRKSGVVERLSVGGSNSRVAVMSDQQFDKFVRRNSVGQSCEAELREVRAKQRREV